MFEALVERQREWPLEAEAQFAVVIHALPASVAPRRSQRQFWPWGRGQCKGSPATPPNSRMVQVRASERPPVPRRPGRNSGRPKGRKGGERGKG